MSTHGLPGNLTSSMVASLGKKNLYVRAATFQTQVAAGVRRLSNFLANRGPELTLDETTYEQAKQQQTAT